MRVFISIDLEGVAGIVDRRQVNRGTDDFTEARALMAGEANAAVDACFRAGATEVVVNDSHGDLANLVPSAMDERALLQIGGGKSPNAMVFRAGPEFHAAIFLGYHARAGTAEAVLEHSFSSATIAGFLVDGEPWGELEFNAAALGTGGVPVCLVAGDDKTCAQAAVVIPGVVTVPVKWAQRRSAARNLSPARARAAIADGVERALAGALPSPVVRAGPFALEVDFLTTAMADSAELAPGSRRTGARRVAITCADVDALTRWRGVLTVLGGAGA